MPSANDQLFLRLIETPSANERVEKLREILIEQKRHTLVQAKNLEGGELQAAMSKMYRDMIATNIEIAAHVNLPTSFALIAYDEAKNHLSHSQFSREVRQTMTEIAVSMKRRESSRIARIVSEVEAQRLAWRHSHEFLSWLAFRRDDDRYPAKDRIERIEAFKVQPRVMDSRESVTRYLGPAMCRALEGHDRFLLANRWLLPPTPENKLERRTWSLLAFTSGVSVRLEQARFAYDDLVGADAAGDLKDTANSEVCELFVQQLARALTLAPNNLPGAVL